MHACCFLPRGPSYPLARHRAGSTLGLAGVKHPGSHFADYLALALPAAENCWRNSSTKAATFGDRRAEQVEVSLDVQAVKAEAIGQAA
jgi:hypothetical protein